MSEGGYVSPPRHRNFVARGKIRIVKSATKVAAYLRIFLSGRRGKRQLVSLKNGKAVFREEQVYLSVYLWAWRGEQLIRGNPVALQPQGKATRHMVAYPWIDMVRQASKSEIVAAIARYARCNEQLDLVTFIARHGGNDGPRIFVQLKQRLLDRFPATSGIDVGLCHGDVTRKNIGFDADGNLVFIDWDDAFTYMSCYDRIYFLVAEHFREAGIDLTYTNVLLRLGLGQRRFVIGEANRFMSSAIGCDLEPLQCGLFLLRYFRSVKQLDGVSAILLGDIDEVVW